ncbi:OLC1v1024691C1 [Oldenlandia corymbosa var. corymbosa]|uniref:OLC1v1024691C1 n=1 Tax=Oldenlandia corymbosa var. corymbosa TaxID=529605 RepID=A0AAV1C570_OLDCO|nr:OLC1v1024691C1 [Oldenlandia corymbosa var. corymbosa]
MSPRQAKQEKNNYPEYIHHDMLDNILVFTQTSQEGHMLQDKLIATNIKMQMDNPCNHIRLQEEMSMGDDGIHKIMPITIDLVCLQTRSQIKFLNPKTTQLASIEWPYDVSLSNCETSFGGEWKTLCNVCPRLESDGTWFDRFVYWRVVKLSSE